MTLMKVNFVYILCRLLLSFVQVSFVCCALNRTELFVGHRSGRIGVFRLCVAPSVSAVHLDDLIGHKDSVLHVAVCAEFFVVATTSADGSCCIWDLNNLKYVRTILQIGEPLTLATVSPTLGDVAIVQDVASKLTSHCAYVLIPV